MDLFPGVVFIGLGAVLLAMAVTNRMGWIVRPASEGYAQRSRIRVGSSAVVLVIIGVALL